MDDFLFGKVGAGELPSVSVWEKIIHFFSIFS